MKEKDINNMTRKIAMGCDHVGLILMEPIKKYLIDTEIQIIDVGTNSGDSVDYPDFAKKACDKVIGGDCEAALLFCGTGVGMSIAANKIKGIRAVVCSEPYSAGMAREHNDANVLALGARVLGIELAKTIVDTWLESKFEGGRHSRRVKMIDNMNSLVRESGNNGIY